MILDSHMHLGEDIIFNTDDSEEDILSIMEEYGIDAALLQTGILTRDTKAANLRLHRMCTQYPGKFWGVCVSTPYLSDEDYFEFVRWGIQDLGFKAIKLHAFAYCASPNSPQAHKVFESARTLNVPVIVHTGNGVPAALPSMLIPTAREFPDLKIVMAHSGAGIYGNEALIVAQECDNIYLETSWCTIMNLEDYVNKLGCDRIMFGVDIPKNAPVELAKYRALKLTDAQYEKCFWKTAQSVFSLN